jgi:HAMP domain-containing protein
MLVYNKLSDLTDLPGIDYKQHRGLESAIQLRLQWFWFRAGALAIAGLVANLPMFLKDGGITPTPWTFAIATAALALALFLLRRVWAELEDIRELRSEVKELERREGQRTEQIQTLRDGVAEWESDPNLKGFGGKTEIKKDLDSSQ